MMDYYATLGVDKTANQDEIKKAYRQSALKYHPDTGGDTKKFQECTEAYETLSDPEKKQFYDMYGSSPSPSMGQGDPFTNFARQNRMHMRRRETIPSRGSHLRISINSTLEESVKDNVERTISYKRQARCNICNNTGLKTGHKRTDCATCKGNGQFVRRVESNNCVMQEISMCPVCQGSGNSIADEDKCNDCHGTGRITEEREIVVKLPVFIWYDQNFYSPTHGVALQGQGNCGANGGPNGDLHIIINVLDHDLFEAKNDHILLYAPITLNQAIFGDSINVPTIYQDVITVDIPKRTKHGDFVKKEKYGRLNASGEKGDMYIIFNVDIPEDIPVECEKALKDVESLWPEVDNKNILDYIERIKNVQEKYIIKGS